jgi:hypothetical protein
MVFKSSAQGTGTIEQISYADLQAVAGLAPNVVPQVFGIKYLGSPSSNTTYDELDRIFSNGDMSVTVMQNLFDFWGPDRQYVQIRSVSIDLAPGSTSASPLVAIKITADAFIAP